MPPHRHKLPDSGRRPNSEVHLVKDCNYRQASMWCGSSDFDDFRGQTDDHFIFESVGFDGGRKFASTALFQVTCLKCKRLAAGIEREKLTETQQSNWIKAVPSEWT